MFHVRSAVMVCDMVFLVAMFTRKVESFCGHRRIPLVIMSREIEPLLCDAAKYEVVGAFQDAIRLGGAEKGFIYRHKVW